MTDREWTDEAIEARLNAVPPWGRVCENFDTQEWLNFVKNVIFPNPEFKAWCEGQVPPDVLADYLKRKNVEP